MSLLDKFFVALGFQVDTGGIDQFEAKTKELRSTVLGLGTLFTGAAIGIGLMVEKVADGMGELQHFAELNQLNVKEVAAWNKIAAMNMISNEDAQSSLQGLNQKLGEAAIHLGRGAMVFKKLGLEAKDSQGHVKSLDTILGEVATKMQNGSRAGNIAMANRLGIDPKFVPVLEQGADALAKMRAEIAATNPFEEADYERALEIDKAFIKVRFTLGYITKVLAVQLFPVVQRVLDVYLRWFKTMKDDQTGPIINAFRTFAGILGDIWGWVERLWNAGNAVLSFLMKFRVSVWAIRLAVAALVAYQVGTWVMGITSAVSALITVMTSLSAASALPIILFGALIAVIALLIDDMVNFYEGNDSVIGQLQKKFPYAIHLAWVALVALSAAFVALKWKAITSMYDTMAIMALYARDWVMASASMIAACWRVAAAVVASSYKASVAALANFGKIAWELGLLTAEYAALAAKAIWSGVTLVASAIATAAGWDPAFGSMAVATNAALWPVLLIIAALALVVTAVWLVWRNWDKITAWMRKAWTWVVDEIKSGINWLLHALDAVGAKIIKVFPFLGKMASWELNAMGMGGMLPATAGGPMATGAGASGSVLGGASNRVDSRSSRTVVNRVDRPVVNIHTTDPDKAGHAVRKEFDSMHRSGTRNAQSGVGL